MIDPGLRMLSACVVGALIALLVVTGCGGDDTSGVAVEQSPTPEQIAERRSALREARATWRRRRLRDYRYRIQRSCFCPREVVGPVRITVRNGRPRGTPEPFRDVDTVRELFAVVEASIPGDELSVRDDARGVPRRIEADPIAGALDDETTYVVSRFRRLPRRPEPRRGGAGGVSPDPPRPASTASAMVRPP